MNLENHRKKTFGQVLLSTRELLLEMDRVYADSEVVSKRFFDTGTVRRIHISKRADLLVMEAGGSPVCVKYFHDRRLRVKLRTFLGLAKGRRGYRNGLRLCAAGVCVPEQLACIELRPFGPTVVVMALIKEAATVVDVLLKRRSGNEKAEVFSAQIKQFAMFVANLHRQGVYHCDFSPRNVMVQQTNRGIEFVLIDLEDVRFGRPLARQRCVQNLARFAREALPYLSVYTTMRFLRFYLKETGQSSSAAGLARAILQNKAAH